MWTRILPLNPNRLMRLARTEITNTVGVLVPDMGNPFYYPFLQGVETIAHKNQTMLFVCDSHDELQEMLRAFAQLAAQHIDGIIAVSAKLNELVSQRSLPSAVLPVVTADWPDCTGYSVQMDLKNAGVEATRHLVQHGHRRIGLITHYGDASNVRPVNQGYAAALKAAHIHMDESLIARVRGWDLEAGRQGAQQLLGLPKPPTAIFAMADMLALGGMEAIHKAGLQIPRDIALTSFNNIAFAGLVQPALTTVMAPAYELGREAMKMLQLLIAGKQPARKRVTLPTSLVIRESCGRHDGSGK
ncbi:MAG: substrate-binding domain-containing protein [Chloroflexota bacterium]